MKARKKLLRNRSAPFQLMTPSCKHYAGYWTWLRSRRVHSSWVTSIRMSFMPLLLLGEAGGDLRRLLTENSRANRVARTIAHIRANLEQGSTIQELIAVSGMSKSTLHETFKTATGQSPLQFQKDLRLLEARSLLATGKEQVSQIAFAVGYSSPTQFARDYKRAFGRTPKQDRRSEIEELI